MKLKKFYQLVQYGLSTVVLTITLSTNPSKANDYPPELQKEVYCLAQNIYFESRGEPVRGQLAVAMVTLNRTKSDDFPSTVCEVVNQGCQFSWVCDGKSDKLPTNSAAGRQAVSLAVQAITNRALVDVTNGALFFHANYSKPSWSKKMEKTIAIGNHIFYRRS